MLVRKAARRDVDRPKLVVCRPRFHGQRLPLQVISAV